MRLKSAGNHAVLQETSKNFQGLVFIPNREITALGFKMERKNINKCFNGLKMEDQGVQSPQPFLVKNFSFLQLLRKRKVSVCFQVSLNTDCRYKAASWTLEYKNDNVQYYFEVQFNFYNDWESHIR